MGLFDSLFGSKQESQEMTKAEAFAGVLMATVAADGHISDEEAQGLWTILRRMKMFENMSEDKCGHMLNKLLGMLKRKGLEALLERCVESLPEKLHPTAFCAACDLALADGGIEDEEKEFLEDLQKRLSIPGDLALTIIEVMLIKNKG